MVKASLHRLAFALGHELAPHGATAVAVTPGWLRSEMMLEAFAVDEPTWRDALDPSLPGRPTAPPGFATSESPRFVGRGVAALAADPDRARWNQRSVAVEELAEAYGFTGRRRLAAQGLGLHRGHRGRRRDAGSLVLPLRRAADRAHRRHLWRGRHRAGRTLTP